MNYEQVQAIMIPGDRVRRQTWGQNFYLFCEEDRSIHLRSSTTPKEAFNPVWAQSGYDAHADDYVMLSRLNREQVYRRLYELTKHGSDVRQVLKETMLARNHPDQLYWIDLDANRYVQVRYNDAPSSTDPLAIVDFYHKPASRT